MNLQRIIAAIVALFSRRAKADKPPPVVVRQNGKVIATGSDVRIEPLPPLAPRTEAPPPVLVPSRPYDPQRLTEHFTVADFIKSDTATRLGINNTPPPVEFGKMRQAARQFERVRTFLRHHPFIHSGYRCPALNQAVGGSPNSAHMDGWAIDFTCPVFGSPLEIAQALAMSEIMQDVDQLIYEYGRWVHISFDPRRRCECLTMFSRDGVSRTIVGLHPV